MREIIRTNDIVLISFVEAVLKDLGIEAMIADESMSVLDGSIGILPRRVLIDQDDFARAKEVLADPAIYPHLNSDVRQEVEPVR